MTFDQMVPSRFLKKEDIQKPAILTITKFEQDNVAREDQPKDMKWVVFFQEFDKPLVLAPTNIQLLKLAVGSNDPDQAIGKKVVVYVDPTVSFGGKVVGGLRIRAPKGSAPAAEGEAEETEPTPF